MKKFTFLIITLLCLPLFSLGQVTTEQVLSTANSYLNHVWTAGQNNMYSNKRCGGGASTVTTPKWVKPGVQNKGLPYNWCGRSTLNEFDQGLLNGKSAGDTDTYDDCGDTNCAVGVDCSGFVCRCYGLGKTYVTSDIGNTPSLFGRYNSFNDLKPGDMVNKAGSHVRLVERLNANGTVSTIESAGGNNDRVMAATYSYSNLSSYKPMYYKKMNHDGNVVITDPIGDCKNAFPLSCGVPTLAKNSMNNSNVSRYACLDRPEVGPESLFSFTPTVNGDFVVATSGYTADHDLDLYVMASCSLSDCIASNIDGTVTVPNAIAGHTYYIMIDTFNKVETDYVVTVHCPTLNRPDIVIDEMWINPEEPEAESPAELFVILKNIGNAASGNIPFQFKINNQLVGSGSHPNLEPGEIVVKKLENYVFANSGDINYCVEINNVANETNTENNSSCVKEVVKPAKRPDLQVEKIWIEPALPEEQHPTNLFVTLKNVGDKDAENVNIQYKIGSNLVGSDAVNKLAVGETITQQLDGYKFPTFGFFNYCVNVSTTAKEKELNNNNLCQQIKVLEREDVTVNLTRLSHNFIMAGNEIEVRSRHSYKGYKEEADLPIITLSYYLSKDNVKDANDLLLGYDLSSLGTQNRNSLETKNLRIPNTTIPGKYYIIFSADNENVIREDDEINNIKYVPLSIDNAFINGDNLQDRVYLYPNPTSGKVQLMVNTDVNIKRVMAYDSSGKLIANKEGDHITEFNLTNVQAGTYILQLYDEHNKTAIFRVLKR